MIILHRQEKWSSKYARSPLYARAVQQKDYFGVKIYEPQKRYESKF